ncbi:MAG: ABC transporter permease [Chloroflexi bacterium]|nr:ABC transporter permease [Chloroflexota bacterium]
MIGERAEQALDTRQRIFTRVRGALLSRTVRQLLRHRLSVIGLSYIGIVIFIAVFANLISPADPLAIDPIHALDPPSLSHPLGLDHNGRDQLSRLFYGARVSLIVGVLAVGVAVAIGVPLGIIAAYSGGWIDHGIMRGVDAMIAIPGLLFTILLLLVLGGGVFTVSLAIGVNLFTTQARLVRSQALSVKEREYFLAARAIGAPIRRLLLVHMTPNSIQPVIVQASLGMGFAILGEAGLSFIGVGVPPPAATWGGMLNMAFRNLNSAPWLSFAPGIAIFLLVLSFNFVGDGLRDVLDPRLRGKI